MIATFVKEKRGVSTCTLHMLVVREGQTEQGASLMDKGDLDIVKRGRRNIETTTKGSDTGGSHDKE